MRLYVATSNRNKVKEIREVLKDMHLAVFGIGELSDFEMPPEDADSFIGNARIKAKAVAEKINDAWILADDSGLCVDALNGAPGLNSARYATNGRNYKANNEKLMHEMENVPLENRSAEFVCAMVLISPEGKEFDVEGRSKGHIIKSLRGDGGFGYDPLFVPEGFDKTFAEMPNSKKNAISHRGRAIKALKSVLNEIIT